MQISWDAFHTRYHAMARALAESLSGRPSEAEDIVQEAMVALIGALRREPERFESVDHARNYFLRAVKNLARKRRSAPRGAPLEREPEAPPERSAEGDAQRARQAALAHALRRLSRPERDLVARRFLRRETLARISDDLGTPISTLHARERALLARLRRTLERAEPGAFSNSDEDLAP